MARKLIFDQQTPRYTNEHVTIFADTRNGFSEKDQFISLQIYKGDVMKYGSNIPEQLKLTDITLDKNDFKKLIHRLVDYVEEVENVR